MTRVYYNQLLDEIILIEPDIIIWDSKGNIHYEFSKIERYFIYLGVL